MELDFTLLFPEDIITSLLDAGLREDGRSADQTRTTTINATTDSIGTADGSSIVRCGGNCVACGIKAELASPASDRPEEGYMVISVDSAVASLPDMITASTITQTIQDIIISSKFIDLKSLCIKEGQLCWVLYIDMMCISIDGIPFDCALLSIITALRNVHLPNVTYEQGKPIVTTENFTCLTLGEAPTSITFGLNKKWSPLVDPDYQELSLCTGVLIISFVNKNKMAGFYKFGGTPFTADEIVKCIKNAKKHCKSHQKLLQSLTVTITQ